MTAGRIPQMRDCAETHQKETGHPVDVKDGESPYFNGMAACRACPWHYIQLQVTNVFERSALKESRC